MSENCKIYTPDAWVDILLDEAGYKSDLYGKRVLENSCGTGNILRRIVERYIVDAIAHGYSLNRIRSGLASDIVGLDTDENACRVCVDQLVTTAAKHEIHGVKWNIINCDALSYTENDFAFVVGNPPYITYHDLSSADRELLRHRFTTCKNGRFDYCYAFIEQSIDSLQQNGTLTYLVPNSILKNVWAEDLRSFLKPYLRKIRDLKNKNVFEDVTLSPVIIVAQKAKREYSEIVYQCDDEHLQISLNSSSFTSDVWALGNYKSSPNRRKFGDYFDVANSVATLLNDAFLITEYTVRDADYILVNDTPIERAVLRPAISIKTLNSNPQPLIIFPYTYDTNGVFTHYTEHKFEEQFPGACAHIRKYRDRLSRRKADKTAKWFEYGRSQAITHLNCEKLVISVMVSGNVHVAIVDDTAVPFAGLYITPKADLPLTRAAEILQHEDFKRYVMQYGVPTTKNSYRISKKILEAYSFD